MAKGLFRIKELAQERGLTTEDLGHKSGLRVSTVRRVWQNRVDDPSFSTLLALARALDVSIEDLVDPSSDGVAKTARQAKIDGRMNGDGQINRAPERQPVAA